MAAPTVSTFGPKTRSNHPLLRYKEVESLQGSPFFDSKPLREPLEAPPGLPKGEERSDAGKMVAPLPGAPWIVTCRV